MSVLTGFIIQSALGLVVSPYITTDLLDYTVDYWPAHDAICSATPIGAYTTAFPVAANGETITGQIAGSFLQDWYFRIHVRPQSLVLGNVASTQVTTVEVWNAFFNTEELVSIDGLEDGLNVSGTIPLIFGALQAVTYSLTIDEDGPSVISASLTWVFSDVVSEPLVISGTRTIAFTFSPDWGDPIKETLSWNTGLQVSPSGAEQARALRISPRRTFQITLLLGRMDRRYFDLVTYGWSSRVFSLPIWPDIQLLTVAVSLGATTITCDTTNRDFRNGGTAILRGESAFNSETVQILSFTSTVLTLVRPTQQAWPTGSRLYPARSAEMIDQPAVTRVTDRGSSISVSFRIAESNDWPAAFPATLYRSVPVLELRPSEADDLTSAYQRLLEEIDNGSAIPQRTDTADLAFPSQSHAWLLGGPAARTAFRSILYAMAGRQGVLWVPTFADDLGLQTNIAATDTTIVVDWCGYTRFAAQGIGRRDIRIEIGDVSKSGTVYHRRITASSEISSTAERLTIDSALGVAVTTAQVGRISYMALCRFDQDDFELDHVTDIAGVATSTATLRGIRDDI